MSRNTKPKLIMKRDLPEKILKRFKIQFNRHFVLVYCEQQICIQWQQTKLINHMHNSALIRLSPHFFLSSAKSLRHEKLIFDEIFVTGSNKRSAWGLYTACTMVSNSFISLTSPLSLSIFSFLCETWIALVNEEQNSQGPYRKIKWNNVYIHSRSIFSNSLTLNVDSMKHAARQIFKARLVQAKKKFFWT